MTTSLVAPKEQENRYEAIVQEVLDEARRQGASAAEAGVGVEKGLSVTVRLGEVDTLEYHHDKGLSVTVFFGNRKGSASTSDLAPAALKETVAAACGIARYTAEDDCAGLADAALMAKDYPDLDLYHPWAVTAEQAVDLAVACEEAARSHDQRITNSEGATVSSHEGIRVYGNSHGFVGGYPTSRHSISCSVIGREGEAMQRDYWYTTDRRRDNLEAPADVGRRAAERTVARLNGRRLGTRKVPVLFAAEVASGLIGHYTRAVRGGSLYRHTSFLLDSLGTQVFPAWMHIHEEPLLKGALGSAPFDSEGVATGPRDLIRDGVVQGYILDAYSARKLSMETTGNAGGLHNLIVDSGDKDLPALLKAMDKGLLVTELMGQGVNGVTGDYSRGAAGFWVENGELQYPVEEITIAGNLKGIYRNIVAVGNDVDLRRNIRTGSVLVEEMMVAGE